VHDRLISVAGLSDPPGYSHAVTVSGRLGFVSGQVAVDAAGQLVGAGDLAAQTAQALSNLHQILRALGADWPDVVRFGWYLLDASKVQVVRDVRDKIIRTALGQLPNPASTLVQVPALVRPGLLVEVEAVVALPD
jgi:enamine deaminase RidA (YjgF/YER057c/UK114 family)